ncbi:Uncharacterised protein [Streptococcus dysgalactiae]|nr:Uncharacterised protein [Streptococcus dysgalactiae]
MRDKIEILKDKANMSLSKIGQVTLRKISHVLIFEIKISLILTIQATNNTKQTGLTTARWTVDSSNLSWCNLKCNIVQSALLVRTVEIIVL